MARGDRNPNRTTSSHSLSDSCALCERDLGGTEPLTKHRGKWFHKSCWAGEHE